MKLTIKDLTKALKLYQQRVEILELTLQQQLQSHYATWMAARAEVEGAAAAHILFHEEPDVIQAREVLKELYPEPDLPETQ